MNNQLQIKYRQTSELLPYERNARTHSGSQVRQVANSIRTFGFINPIILDKDDVIVAGHARLLAARQLGLEIVPTIRVDHLSESERRAYILADNKIAENAGWDKELLRVELGYLSQIDVDIDVDLTGFDTAEIDLILSLDESPSDDEYLPPLAPDGTDTLSQPGDLWLLGPHRLLCGDCRQKEGIERIMNGQEAQMIITDPPYNVPVTGHICGKGKVKHREFAMASGEMSKEEFTDFLSDCLGQLASASADNSLHYVFMDWRHMEELLTAGKNHFNKLINLCVWAKNNGGMGSLYRSQHELVFIYRKGKESHINNVELGVHGRYRTNLWTYPGVNSFGNDRDNTLVMHPTVKPVQLIADAIMDVTSHGDIVLDGFIGSGSTLMAAEQTGRICYGIEIDPGYVDVVLKRWIAQTGKQPIHAESGYSLADIRNLCANTLVEV